MTQESHYRLYSLRKPTIIQKDTCTLMFTEALFTIARSWKQPKCPSTDDRRKKMCYVHRKDYYLLIKRNKFESNLSLMRGINQEPVLQTEVSQKEKNKYHILTHICGIYKNGTDEPTGREARE